jgi:hypothetical protein
VRGSTTDETPTVVRPRRLKWRSIAVFALASAVLVGIVLGGRYGAPQCVYLDSQFTLDITFANGTPNESHVRAFAAGLAANSTWEANVDHFYTLMNGTALAAITLSISPSGPVRDHSASLNLWTGNGSSALLSTLKLHLLGGEDHGNGPAIVSELTEVARSEAGFLAAQLASAFGEVSLQESPFAAGHGGCCPVC